MARTHNWNPSPLPRLSIGKEAGTEAILRFLARVATPAWLEERYKEAPAYGIAASINTLWGFCEQSVIDQFRIDALKIRLIDEMRYLKYNSRDNLSAQLQLLGSSALIGVYVDKSKVQWPSIGPIHEVVRLTEPKGDQLGIGNVQIQVWLGLREMARLRSEPITVPADSGRKVLSLWQKSSGRTNKQKLLNSWMIDWLKRCATSGWILIPDSSPIAESLESIGALDCGVRPDFRFC